MLDPEANEVSLTGWSHPLPMPYEKRRQAGPRGRLGAPITAVWLVSTLFLAAGAAKFAMRGPVLAWSLSLDFKTFYAASRAWALGMNPYNHELLNSILERAGASSGQHTWSEEPSIYPPMTYAALSPLALLPWRTARLLWCVLNLAGLTLAVVIVCRFGAFTPGLRMVLLLGAVLALQPSSAAMRVGQLSILVTALGMASLLLGRYERDSSSGFLLGLALALKPQLALVFVAPGLVRRRWKTLFAVTLTLCAIGSVSVLRIHAVSAWAGSWFANLSSSFRPAGVNNVAPSSEHNRNMVNLQYPLRLMIHSSWAVNVLVLAVGTVLAIPAVRILTSEDISAPELLQSVSLLAIVELLVMYHRDYDAVLLALPLGWALSAGVPRRRALPAILMIAVFFFPILHALYALDGTAGSHWLLSSLLARFLVWPYQAWTLFGLAAWLSYCCTREKAKTVLTQSWCPKQLWPDT
jgi:hypothetical protein